METELRVYGDELSAKEEDERTRIRAEVFVAEDAGPGGRFQKNEKELTDHVESLVANDSMYETEVFPLHLSCTVNERDLESMDGMFSIKFTELINIGRQKLDTLTANNCEVFIISSITRTLATNTFPFPVHVDCCIKDSDRNMGLTTLSRCPSDASSPMPPSCLFMMPMNSDLGESRLVYEAPPFAYSRTLSRYAGLAAINFKDPEVVAVSGVDRHYHSPNRALGCPVVDLLWHNPELGMEFFPVFYSGTAEEGRLWKTKAVLSMGGKGMPSLIDAILPLQRKVKRLRLATTNNPTIMISLTPDTLDAWTTIEKESNIRVSDRRRNAWADTIREHCPVKRADKKTTKQDAAPGEDSQDNSSADPPLPRTFNINIELEFSLAFQAQSASPKQPV